MNLVPLSDVAKIERNIASEEECDSLPYVGLEHIEKETGHFISGFQTKPESLLATKFKFSPKHVLYGKLRPYLNKVVLPWFDGVCTTEILPILPNEGKLDRTYLWAYLHTSEFVDWASSQVSGANLPRLDPKLLADHPIPFPPLPEQRRIAALLAKADRLRRLRRNALELGEGFLQAVFLEMFGDPGSNPKGWKYSQLVELLSKDRKGLQTGPFGSSLKRHEYVKEGIPVWGIENLGNNEFIETGSLFITPYKFSDLKNYSVHKGDILISRAGTVGRMCVAHPSRNPSIIGTNLIRLSLDNTFAKNRLN